MIITKEEDKITPFSIRFVYVEIIFIGSPYYGRTGILTHSALLSWY